MKETTPAQQNIHTLFLVVYTNACSMNKFRKPDYMSNNEKKRKTNKKKRQNNQIMYETIKCKKCQQASPFHFFQLQNQIEILPIMSIGRNTANELLSSKNQE